MRTILPKALLAAFAAVWVSACSQSGAMKGSPVSYGTLYDWDKSHLGMTNNELCDTMIAVAGDRVSKAFTPDAAKVRVRMMGAELYRRNFLCTARTDEPEQVRKWRQKFKEDSRAEAAYRKAEEERRRAEVGSATRDAQARLESLGKAVSPVIDHAPLVLAGEPVLPPKTGPLFLEAEGQRTWPFRD